MDSCDAYRHFAAKCVELARRMDSARGPLDYARDGAALVAFSGVRRQDSRFARSALSQNGGSILHGERPYRCPLWVKSRHRISANRCRLYPKSGHCRVTAGCPLCARSGHGVFILPALHHACCSYRRPVGRRGRRSGRRTGSRRSSARAASLLVVGVISVGLPRFE